MNCFEKGVKFGVIFKNLNGIDLLTEDMDLPVSVYNFLKRNGVNNLEQLLSKSGDDLINKTQSRNYVYITRWLGELSEKITRDYILLTSF